MKVSATLLYGLAATFGLMGVLLLIVPFIGLPLLGIAFVLYIAANTARRKAREIDVRRQQGG